MKPEVFQVSSEAEEALSNGPPHTLFCATLVGPEGIYVYLSSVGGYCIGVRQTGKQVYVYLFTEYIEIYRHANVQ